MRFSLHKGLVAALLVSLLASGCSPKSSLERVDAEESRPAWPTPTPLQPFLRADHEVQFIDGRKEKFSALLARRKVLVVNFWATWCAPCRREIPVLTALDREYRARGVDFIGLSLEEPETIDVVKAFKAQYSMDYEIGYAPGEMFDDFSGMKEQGIIPQTFVFGANGDLILHMRGFKANFREMIVEAFARAGL